MPLLHCVANGSRDCTGNRSPKRQIRRAADRTGPKQTASMRITSMSDYKISEEGKRGRFAQWEKFGVDRIKADLLYGGHRLVGGPPAVRDLAWEWVRKKEAEQREAVTLKPTVYGVGVDLNELWRRIAHRFRQR